MFSEDVTVFSPKGKTILTGWRENKLPKLWRFALKPTEEFLMHHTLKSQTTPSDHSAYDLTSVEALVRYMHEAVGLPVNYTWLRAIKSEIVRHVQD